MVRVLPGSSPQADNLLIGEREENPPFSRHLRTKEPFDMTVERFLASLRFENKAKLDDFGFVVDKIPLNQVNSGSSPVSKFQGFSIRGTR